MGDLCGERSNFNAKARLDRAADQLLGICSGIVADGEINHRELAFLSTWLAEHREVCEIFPGKQIARRLAEVMADGRVSVEEHSDLLLILQQISGNSFIDTGAAAPAAPAIPADESPVIEIPGKSFCFTGTFAFGSRGKCEAAVKALGACCGKDVTLALDYLVIGAGVSPDWKHETYGRKIERALEIRSGGQSTPVIILEEQWVSALDA